MPYCFRPGDPYENVDLPFWVYAGDTDVLHLTEADSSETQVVDVLTTLDHVALNCAGRAAYEATLSQHRVLYKVAQQI